MNNPNKIEIYNDLKRELEERKKIKQFYLEDFICIEVNVANDWIYSDWRGYQTESSVMKGCEKILEAMVQNGFSKILNDNTNVLGIWTPAAKWVGSDWFPRMIENGLKQFAWIYSPSALSRVSTDEALNNTPEHQLGDVIKTFYSMKEGKQWLAK
jgi:hypothetical protein